MNFKPKFLATAIGSLPHANANQAVDVVMKAIPEAPIWPQVSSRGLHEQMEIQYSEGMPCRVIDEAKGRMFFQTDGDYSEAFAEFYENYMLAMDIDEGTGDCSAMAISPEYSAGIYALEARLQAEGGTRPFVKVQTTGPCSFSLTVVDENKRALYYNEEFRDMIVKALAMKCRWQIQKFKPYADNIICFVDEPILSAFGSSTYVSVQREDVVALLQEMVDAVHADGALCGVHCCGNTEWSLLMDAGVDIVNFDAFEFGETIAMYSDHVKKHLEAGKALAWGVVPTSKAIREQSVETLMAQYEKVVDHLVERSGIAKQLILEQTIITPSCGTGSMEIADAEKVFELNGKLSAALKEKYGF
jgi:hypothetical protein